MAGRLRALRDGQGGWALVFVGMGLMAFFGVSVLAIDVGMVLTGRSQAQNAADAGALGGAVALALEDYDDRSASGPAVQNAIAAATANPVMGQAVSVGSDDVTFPANPQGVSNWVRVQVFRSAERANPVTTLVASVLGIESADITATATAEASPANAAKCVLPMAVPDKWIERQSPPWDTGDTFSAYPKNPSVQPDVYHPAGQSNYSGYSIRNDVGLLLPVKLGTGNEINPSIFYPLALSGSTGGDDYAWNIVNCNTSVMHIFDRLEAEPGNMVGPTAHAIQELIAKDPDAYWDSANQKVVSSLHPSPRVKLMPVFDPYYYDTGKVNGRPADLKAANFIGVFIESLQGNTVMARVMPAIGVRDSAFGPIPSGAFPMAVRLVR